MWVSVSDLSFTATAKHFRFISLLTILSFFSELTLPFPPRDVTVQRNVEVREKFTMGEEVGR